MQDHTEAVRWYRLAADQGHAEDQNNLGDSFPRRKDGIGWTWFVYALQKEGKAKQKSKNW